MCWSVRGPGLTMRGDVHGHDHHECNGRKYQDGTLALILGPLRAAALQVLHHPLTVNELAAAVHCAPTTATYHLQQLATASLVTRERHGTSVRVSRTTRGDKLIDLLSDLSGFSTRPVAPVTSTGGMRLRAMGTYVDPTASCTGSSAAPGHFTTINHPHAGTKRGRARAWASSTTTAWDLLTRRCSAWEAQAAGGGTGKSACGADGDGGAGPGHEPWVLVRSGGGGLS